MRWSRWFAGCVVLCLPQAGARADYDPPTFEQVVARSTDIVDADVVSLAEAGHARLKVRDRLKGDHAPTMITGVFLTCEPDNRDLGLKAGKRYVLCLRNDLLYEFSTAYEIRAGGGGVLECEYRDSRTEPAKAKDSHS